MRDSAWWVWPQMAAWQRSWAASGGRRRGSCRRSGRKILERRLGEAGDVVGAVDFLQAASRRQSASQVRMG